MSVWVTLRGTWVRSVYVRRLTCVDFNIWMSRDDPFKHDYKSSISLTLLVFQGTYHMHQYKVYCDMMLLDTRSSDALMLPLTNISCRCAEESRRIEVYIWRMLRFKEYLREVIFIWNPMLKKNKPFHSITLWGFKVLRTGRGITKLFFSLTPH